MTYVKIGEIKYPAFVAGRIMDKDWDNRSSKYITVEMSYEDALEIFVDDIEWSIVCEIEEPVEIVDGEGNVSHETKIAEEVYDNSEYSIAGDIVNHRNGTITAKMGKPTAEELLAIIEEGLN